MAVPSPSPETKSELRAEGLRLRRDFARSLTPELGARVVAAYHPLRDEISPYPIIASLGDGQRAALPWFAGRDARMLWREAPASEPSPWGVLQPPPDAEALAPDIVLVPLVLADRRGTRIGHGKGHYDRALAHLREGNPVTTIGLGWESQIVDGPIPADPWDMKLDAIATPKEWISCV